MSNTTSSIISEDLTNITATNLPWERLRNKVILVTGASGFLPAYIVETLLHLNTESQLGCKVVGLVRNLARGQNRFAPYKNRKDLELIEGDVAVERTWTQRCDMIIHAASQASPMYYGTDPVGTMNANLLGTSHLLRMAHEWKSEEFLFFSSGEVYGQVAPDKIPTKETDYGYIDINDSRACYAESKRAAETLGISFAAQHNVPFKIVRPFHTYGPGMALNDGRVFADFVNDIVNSRNIIMRSDGKAVRAFCYLSDAVAGFFTVLLKGENRTAYNVGNPGGAISIGELADVLVTLFPEKNLAVSREVQPAREGYMPSPISINCPNVDRLSALGWKPSSSVADGFKRTISHYMAQSTTSS